MIVLEVNKAIFQVKLALFGEDLHSCESISSHCEVFPRIYSLIQQRSQIYILRIPQSLKFLAQMELLISGIKNRDILREMTNFISKNSYFPESSVNLKVLLKALVT